MYNRQTRSACINCGSVSHVYKHCQQPTTSYGIVAYRSMPPTRNKSVHCELSVLNLSAPSTDRMTEGMHSSQRRCHRHRRVDDCPDTFDPNACSAHGLLFLMVQRKDTMAYTDLVRGIYPNEQPERDQIISTFVQELICEEREKLLMMPFQQIWDDLWLNHGRSHANEFAVARAKFDQIKIRKLLEEIPCRWTQQEFGFPKGRRNMNEGVRQCAVREFCEESGYLASELTIVSEEPFIERFRGTNNKEYRHVYYVARVHADAKGPRFDPNNIQQAAEIRQVAWFTYEQCLAVMRPYDTAKKETFERIHATLIPFCCGDDVPK